MKVFRFWAGGTAVLVFMAQCTIRAHQQCRAASPEPETLHNPQASHHCISLQVAYYADSTISLQNHASGWHSLSCRIALGVIFDVLECSRRPADARNRSAARFCASLCLSEISWASLGCKVMSRQKWSEILMKSSLEIVIILKMFTKCSTFFTFEKCDWHVSFNFAFFSESITNLKKDVKSNEYWTQSD